MDKLIEIRDKIYELRGQKVMLDRDLAAMYGIETRILNQAVKRNADRFPDDFMFQLNNEEFNNLISQNGISNWGGVRKRPYAFTELGVAMLSSVLNSKTAIQVNIGIMRAFVVVRQAIGYMSDTDKRITLLESNFKELRAELEEIFSDYNDINEDTRMQLELINESLAEMQVERRESKSRKRIGFIQE